MKKFTKEEFKGIAIIFFILIAISFPNFAASVKRSRDTTRKNDFGSLVEALNTYQEDFGEFPMSSSDGKIVICKSPGDKVTIDEKGRMVVDLIPCEWGEDAIMDLIDETKPPYIKPIPNDPQAKFGLKYMYVSNGRRYQLYASLEEKNQDEYDPAIIKRGISCGERVCNYGRAYGPTPLNKSIEEYEQELLQNQ